jgi:hypothetical protein
MGICFNYEQNDSKEILENILINTDNIRNTRWERFETFKSNNWEKESLKLVKTLDNLI